MAATGTPGSSRRALVRRIGLATIVFHLLYYTLVIGGDHFEYRVYSHLVLPILLSFVRALSRLRLRPGAALALLAAFVLLSEPVTRRLATRQETRRMRVALAPHWPAPVRWYARGFDALLPGVNILDLLGLNDRVIARAPVEAERFRGMAHERTAPEGYVDCFRRTSS